MPFARKYIKQLLHAGLDSLKTSFKKVVHKTSDFIGNKITGAVAKSSEDKTIKEKYVIDENPRNVEEIIVPPEKRKETLNELRPIL